MELRIPPPIVDGLALMAVLALWHFAPHLQWTSVPLWPAMIVGGAVVAVGFYMALIAVGLFKKSKTTILPFIPHKSSALVTDGIYAITRNPMYLGMALVVLGASIIARHPLGVIPLLLACAYLTKFQITPEERALEATFGADYLDYKSRVRRWI